MSHNICFVAVCNGIEIGKFRYTLQIHTASSFEIYNSSNPVEAYKKWVNDNAYIEDADDEAFLMEHIQRLDEWVNNVHEAGCEVKPSLT